MDKTSKKNLASDINNKLDDFFGAGEKSSSGQTSSPSLEKLKTVVLSIDWEITDECMQDLNTEIDAMLPQWQHDRLAHALLRMLKGLGNYIRNFKAQAHQDAIKRVMSAFQSLEKLVGDEQLSEEEKKRILAKEINSFKELKQTVESGRGETKGTHPDQTCADFVEQQKFEKAMNDVEKRLNDQVALLKSQLENVQKEIDALRNT